MNNKMEITIHNAETGEIIQREMNEEEIAQWELDTAKALSEAKAEKEKISAKNALLEKLGITEEEAKLLLG